MSISQVSALVRIGILPRQLQERLNGVQVHSAEKLGLDPDAKEVWTDTFASLRVPAGNALTCCFCRLYALLCLVTKHTEEGLAMSQVRMQCVTCVEQEPRSCSCMLYSSKKLGLVCRYVLHTRLCCV